jgi:hypothetical protein
MQAIPDARQQSFEEIYGPPENFLEIEVRPRWGMDELQMARRSILQAVLTRHHVL